MKDGPPFAIDHTILYELVSDPAFFRRVPALFFMKDQATAVAKQVLASLTGQPVAGCSGCGSVRQLMLPAMETFVRTVIALKAEAPEMLEPLAAYVAERRRYRPRPILVYYKQQGTDALLSVRF